jgi:tRNA A-37 threonylcarbamoyl transferase component Bud32
MPIASNAALVEALRQHRLLDSKQLEELDSLQRRFADPEALVGELVLLGWLTPYQASHLLQGKAHELVLGSYILLEPVGEGGMGQVFKARHRNLGRITAIKRIHKKRLDDPHAIRRFQREVRAAAALSHPNIVMAYDADQIGDTHLLVMEYVEGATDLARLVKTNGPLPVSLACEYIRQAALGLQHAFERGMVHRDIKPANLLVTANGQRVKILDLGLARLDHSSTEDSSSSTMTQERAFMGTPDFIAPEQAMESHTVDIRADLYSLGCTFFFLLTGRAPFPTGSLLQKLNKHQRSHPTALMQLRSDVPPEVEAVVRKLMAKRPEDRYQTPAEVVTALAAVASTSREPARVTCEAASTAVFPPQEAAGTAGSTDTFDSALGYMAKRKDTVPIDPPHRRRPGAATRPWLMFGVLGGSVVLVSAAVLLLVWLLNEPTDTKPPVSRRQIAVVTSAPCHKVPGTVDDCWLQEVAALPAAGQVKAVSMKLRELNHAFAEKVTHKSDGGVVTEVHFFTDNVTDISPLRALRQLKGLRCDGSGPDKGRLADLAPLRGMSLTWLNCNGTQVADLSPLADMPLAVLEFDGTKVADLSPLKAMKLTHLSCGHTRVTDLSPLNGIPLKHLWCDFKAERDAHLLRSIKTLETINNRPATEFWKEIDEKTVGRKP